MPRRAAVTYLLVVVVVVTFAWLWFAERSRPSSPAANPTPLIEDSGIPDSTGATKHSELASMSAPDASSEPASSVGDAEATSDRGVHGEVLDASGRPLEGATVEVHDAPVPRGFYSLLSIYHDLIAEPRPLKTAVSKADGSFRVDGVSGGSYTLIARKKGHTSDSRDRIRVNDDGDFEPVRLTLKAGLDLVGTVIRPDLSPVAGVQVVAIGAGKSRSRTPAERSMTTTDERGRFALDGLDRGTWRVFATRKGESVWAQVAWIDVPTAGPLQFVIDGDAWITGRVTDDLGSSVAGARVTWNSHHSWATTSTDAEGRYELRSLRANDDGVLQVVAAGLCPHPAEPDFAIFGKDRNAVELTTGENVQDVVLARGARVRGVVIDATSGQPLVGVMVGTSHAMFAGLWPRTRTAADGTFALDGVPRGRSIVMAWKRGWWQPAPDGEWLKGHGDEDHANDGRLAIGPDDALVDTTIRLRRAIIVRGRVLAVDGAPISGADVVARPLEDEQRHAAFFGFSKFGDAPTKTDAKGRFAVEAHFDKGGIVIAAMAEGFLPGRSAATTLAAAMDGSAIEIRLGKGGAVEGRVTDAETGQPIAGVRILPRSISAAPNSLSDDQFRDFLLTDDDGRYHIAGLTPGTIEINVYQDGYLKESRQAEVKHGATTKDVDLRLQRGRTISGRVVNADGSPADRATLTVASMDMPNSESWVDVDPTDNLSLRGSFEIENLRAGSYRLAAIHPDSERRGDPVVVEAGATNVELRLPAAFEIAGTVRFVDGSPAEGVDVSLWPQDPTALERGFVSRPPEYGPRGSFRFVGVDPGNYDLTVGYNSLQPGANIQSTRAEGVAAGTLNLVVEVKRGLTIKARVQLSAGAQITTGWISCSPDLDPDESRYTSFAAPDANGFELRGLSPGPQVLDVELEGFAETRYFVDAGEHDLVVSLAQAATIKGSVIGAKIDEGTEITVWINDGRVNGGTHVWCDVKPDGTFVLTGVGPGVHTLRASTDSEDPPREGTLPNIRVAEGKVLDGVEIRLSPRK